MSSQERYSGKLYLGFGIAQGVLGFICFLLAAVTMGEVNGEVVSTSRLFLSQHPYLCLYYSSYHDAFYLSGTIRSLMGGSMACSLCVIICGIMGCLLSSRKMINKESMKTSYLILTILAASIFAPIGICVFSVGAVMLGECRYLASHDLYIATTIAAFFMFAELVIAIISSSIICCCSKRYPYTTMGVVGTPSQQPQPAYQPYVRPGQTQPQYVYSQPIQGVAMAPPAYSSSYSQHPQDAHGETRVELNVAASAVPQNSTREPTASLPKY